MRFKQVKALMESAVLEEREACANIAGGDAALKIRARSIPAYQAVRPETLAKKPELLKKAKCIMVGWALVDDKIVNARNNRRPN